MHSTGCALLHQNPELVLSWGLCGPLVSLDLAWVSAGFRGWFGKSGVMGRRSRTVKGLTRMMLSGAGGGTAAILVASDAAPLGGTCAGGSGCVAGTCSRA